MISADHHLWGLPTLKPEERPILSRSKPRQGRLGRGARLVGRKISERGWAALIR